MVTLHNHLKRYFSRYHLVWNDRSTPRSETFTMLIHHLIISESILSLQPLILVVGPLSSVLVVGYKSTIIANISSAKQGSWVNPRIPDQLIGVIKIISQKWRRKKSSTAKMAPSVPHPKILYVSYRVSSQNFVHPWHRTVSEQIYLDQIYLWCINGLWANLPGPNLPVMYQRSLTKST